MPTRAALRRMQPLGDSLLAVPGDVRSLAAQQSGVTTRRQLAGFGITVSRIEAQVAARRWRTFGRNVVVLGNGPLTRSQRQWVAVLLVAKRAALAGPSAAEVDGLRGFEPELVHIVVSHDTHTAFPRWVKVHESRRFGVADISYRPGIPRTAIARSLVDSAAWSTGQRRACALLCAGVQQRLLRPEELDAQLARCGRVRHISVMRSVIGDIAGGGHTLSEINLGSLARRAGLGAPNRQALRREGGGKVRYVDAEFGLPDGTRLVVEIDGAVHLRPLSYWDDMDRQNELVIAGSPVLRFGSTTVRLEPGRVVDQLARIRRAHER